MTSFLRTLQHMNTNMRAVLFTHIFVFEERRCCVKALTEFYFSKAGRNQLSVWQHKLPPYTCNHLSIHTCTYTQVSASFSTTTKASCNIIAAVFRQFAANATSCATFYIHVCALACACACVHVRVRLIAASVWALMRSLLKSLVWSAKTSWILILNLCF